MSVCLRVCARVTCFSGHACALITELGNRPKMKFSALRFGFVSWEKTKILPYYPSDYA